jgi:hypothetical protein
LLALINRKDLVRLRSSLNFYRSLRSSGNRSNSLMKYIIRWFLRNRRLTLNHREVVIRISVEVAPQMDRQQKTKRMYSLASIRHTTGKEGVQEHSETLMRLTLPHLFYPEAVERISRHSVN